MLKKLTEEKLIEMLSYAEGILKSELPILKDPNVCMLLKIGMQGEVDEDGERQCMSVHSCIGEDMMLVTNMIRLFIPSISEGNKTLQYKCLTTALDSAIIEQQKRKTKNISKSERKDLEELFTSLDKMSRLVTQLLKYDI